MFITQPSHLGPLQPFQLIYRLPSLTSSFLTGGGSRKKNRFARTQARKNKFWNIRSRKGGTILSIQSHVAYGYVGNKAAVFPLQCLGFDVIVVNTVQFSNHTGYAHWTGEVFSKDHIDTLLDTVLNRAGAKNIDAVLTGYIGDAGLGETILEKVQLIREQNKDVIYVCDPVMGDKGRGLFVHHDLPAFFKKHAVPIANVITPNQFELETMTGQTIDTIEDVEAACRLLHGKGRSHKTNAESGKGPHIILVTSLLTAEAAADRISMLVSCASGKTHTVTTPRLHFPVEPNGAGDLTAALFTGHLLLGLTPDKALEKTATAVYRVLKLTLRLNRRELALVQGRRYFFR